MKSWWVILIFTVMAVLSATLPDLMLSPGPLTKSHQVIRNQCTACHRPFGGVQDARCTHCHQLKKATTDTSAQKAGWSSADLLRFHRQLKEPGCLSCHTDHRGKDPRLATSAFDHALLPVAMKTACESCHAAPADSLHRLIDVSCYNCHTTEEWSVAGTFDHDRIIGVAKTACGSCHPAPGDAFHQLLQEPCGACHSTTQWVPSTFDHARYFTLDRDHNVKCITCHTNNNFKVYTCYGCHEHSESGIRGEHEKHGIFNFSDCASCHRSADEDDIRQPGSTANNHTRPPEPNGVRQYIRSGKREEHHEEEDH